MEIIKKEQKEIKQKKSRIKEQTKEDNNEMGNICDPYYEL